VLLLLVLRLLRASQRLSEHQRRWAALEHAPELPVGLPAPRFRARTLDGEPVGREDYADRDVVFLFMSPDCSTCRRELRGLTRLARAARERAGVELVIVSDGAPAQTHEWLRAACHEDGVELGLPVLVAPHQTTDFVPTYNARMLLPYFCLVDRVGIVRSRDLLGAGGWLKLRAQWEGRTTPAERV
jgi:peroxiredoxin